jgi:zinc protease
MKRAFAVAAMAVVFAAAPAGTIHAHSTTAMPAAKPAPQATPAQKPDEQIRFKVEKYKLANGLTVLLHEDHSVPIISYQTFFRVGSRNEEPGFTGMAHLFEHMMFKGAKRYSGEQFDTILQANGATNNAFTTNDFTGYHENLPSDKLELVIDIESDRMENLKVTQENLNSEREVVKEERRYRVDNNPIGILNEALYGTAYKVSPYHWPVIGYMSDLDNVTVEKAQEFFRTYYAPNNAVVVVAGDFNSDKAKKLIEKYYGHIKAQPIPQKAFPQDPPQKDQRMQVVTREVQNPSFLIAYHTPKAFDEEAYALDLLANIMGRGTSSRLYKRLVYKGQSATSASAYNSSLLDAGLFEVHVALKPGQNWQEAERTVYGEMWRPRHLLVSNDELQMAKNQVIKGYIDGLKTVYGKAQSLASYEIQTGEYEIMFKELERYQKVTPEQIRKVAAKYLNPQNSTLIVLKPGPREKQPEKKSEKKQGTSAQKKVEEGSRQ